jgi:hypothetical protein
MEGGVETGHLRHVGPPFGDGANGQQIVRLMQRCERRELLEFGEYERLDAHRRCISAAAMHDPQAMLAANQKLVTRLLALGGKVYPPYAPVLTQEQWRQHYGSTIWQRFAAAKKRFDPNNVLTPGAGLF